MEDEDDEEEVEKNPPMMLPLADILNHVSHHNACLKFSQLELQMLAMRDIKAVSAVQHVTADIINV